MFLIEYLNTEYDGSTNYPDVRGSRDAIRKALEMGLIDDRRWMETIEDRNLTVHFYEKEIVADVCCKIKALYNALFLNFANKMQSFV